ncbi:MAG: hypothetical protein ACRYFR_04135 [Janthinobacterium lividum]
MANVIKNFVVKHRQERYLVMLTKPNPSGGYGFGQLAHFTQELDLRFCKQIPGALRNVASVLKEINSLTQTLECYVMHERNALDGNWMSIEEGLDKVLGQNEGAFIIIDNGEIIYHESENIKGRYIGVRRPHQQKQPV